MMAVDSNLSDILTSPWTIEREFDPIPWQLWMRREGVLLWIVCTGLYLVMIFRGTKLMETHSKYELRSVLIVWNAALAVFSMISAWRLTIAANDLVSRTDPWHSLVCGPHYYEGGGHSAIWLLLFAFSKVAEYGDTFFIVLRKAKLIFLHWYHHILTFSVGFHTFAYSNPTLFISALMNVYVHSLMYSYYALRIIGVRVPKRLAMVLTTIQIIQLAIGTYAQFYAAVIFFFGGPPCKLDLFAVVVGSFGYGSLCLLFVNFFISSYLIQGRDKTKLKDGQARKDK